MKKKYLFIASILILTLVTLVWAWTILLDINGQPVTRVAHGGGQVDAGITSVQMDPNHTYYARVIECMDNACGEVITYKADDPSVVILDQFVPYHTTGDLPFTTPTGNPQKWMCKIINSGIQGQNDRMTVQWCKP